MSNRVNSEEIKFSNRSRIKRDFFLQPTLKVAQELLGKYLVHRVENREIRGKIVETEAYIGPKDLASHARSGKITSRNLAEYMVGGHVYIYLVYGMYWQLNFSTGKSGEPECVLIRALEPILASRHEYNRKCHNYKFKRNSRKFVSKLIKIRDLANGPGKLCRYMKLDGRYYGLDLVTSKEVWLEPGEKVPESKIVAAKRIGIDYAGKYWANKEWRFSIKNNSFVSKK